MTRISLRPYLHTRVNEESLLRAVGSKERIVTEHPRYYGIVDYTGLLTKKQGLLQTGAQQLTF